ncbi:response regulator transcription factor [Priestia megaterium]|uniref:response regulator transcription factor n=1 Tax=Priestia megaterium TaxID=1404 RepID=UPI0023646FFA|nr:response regulator transcription factor [Priestia megaterium]MDD1511680.1 response regulator transcription factor [Priestia megaterium]
MTESILIVEDEVEIGNILKMELEHEGYQVKIKNNGRDGLQMALSHMFDLILLDIMLPEMSGIEVLRKVRKRENYVPIILLTARNSTLDKILGLDHGANDYITKPFKTEELLARIRSLLRYKHIVIRNKVEKDSLLLIKDMVINTESREVIRAGQKISLTPKEYDLLIYLALHKNKTVTREGILLNLWGYEYEGDTNILDVYISYLRKKIEEGFSTSLIETVRGVGYTIKES